MHSNIILLSVGTEAVWKSQKRKLFTGSWKYLSYDLISEL